MSREPEILPIRVYGDVMLRIVLEPVQSFDDKLRLFIRDLTHTMYARDGVGLSANQVGHNLRVFVIDSEWSKEGAERSPVAMINPVITTAEGEYEIEEGCLSLPDIFTKVKRFNKISYTYTDLYGQEHKEEAEGFKAVVIQHENDHLNGVFFIDRISKLALLKYKRKLKLLMSTAENGKNLRQEVPVPDHVQIG